jgi:hypothetical protein
MALDIELYNSFILASNTSCDSSILDIFMNNFPPKTNFSNPSQLDGLAMVDSMTTGTILSTVFSISAY